MGVLLLMVLALLPVLPPVLLPVVVVGAIVFAGAGAALVIAKKGAFTAPFWLSVKFVRTLSARCRCAAGFEKPVLL